MVKNTIHLALREPLLQFLLMGILIFSANAWLEARRDNPRKIVIDDTQFEQLIDVFQEGQGRAPTANEMSNMVVKWTQNEIMYREGLQLQLDQGDDMIRNRLVLKMHNILFNKATPMEPSESDLKLFFETNRVRYDKPSHYDFEQIFIAENIAEAQLQELLKKLTAGDLPDEYRASYMNYRHRPLSNMTAMFGTQGSTLLSTSRLGEWQTVKSHRGVHFARVTYAYPSQPADFENVKSHVARDWRKYQNDLQLARQTVEIAGRYHISLELSDENKKHLAQAETLQERFRKSIENSAERLDTAAVDAR